MQQEIQAVFNEEFVPTAREWPIGTVGVIDGSGFVKRGTRKRRRATAMVRTPGQEGELPGRGVPPGRDSGRQRAAGSPTVLAGGVGRGRRAAEEDARPAGDHLPDEAADRRRAGGRSSVRFDWVTADEEFGRDGAFLDALEQRQQRYLVEVPCDTTVWADKADAADAGRVRLASASVGRRRFPPRRGGSSSFAKERRGRWRSSLPGCGCGRCGIVMPVRRCGC